MIRKSEFWNCRLSCFLWRYLESKNSKISFRLRSWFCCLKVLEKRMKKCSMLQAFQTKGKKHLDWADEEESSFTSGRSREQKRGWLNQSQMALWLGLDLKKEEGLDRQRSTGVQSHREIGEGKRGKAKWRSEPQAAVAAQRLKSTGLRSAEGLQRHWRKRWKKWRRGSSKLAKCWPTIKLVAGEEKPRLKFDGYDAILRICFKRKEKISFHVLICTQKVRKKKRENSELFIFHFFICIESFQKKNLKSLKILGFISLCI